MMYLSGHKSPPLKPYLDRHELGLLNQPTVRYAMDPSWIWAADNGCFNNHRYVGDALWQSWLARQDRTSCLFAVAPDVVGSHAETLKRSAPLLPVIRSLGYQSAFVLQDGARVDTVPWDDFDWLFIGGTTEFKLMDSPVFIREALDRGKKVHVGRVNSKARYLYFAQMGAHSADGTFIGFGPRNNLPIVLSWIEEYRRMMSND